jgi:hypothetical protein
LKGIVVPARQEYSHSASLGSHYTRPVIAARRRQNSSAWFQVDALDRQVDALEEGRVRIESSMNWVRMR